MTNDRITVMIKADASHLCCQLEGTQFRLNSYILDREALQHYRYLRVQVGHTDHKRELRRERLPRNIERLSRAMRKSGIELGWLFGHQPTWDWPTFTPAVFDQERE